MLLVRQGRRFTGGAADDDGIRSVVDLVIQVHGKLFIVYSSVQIERSHNGNAGTGKNGVLHRYSFLSKTIQAYRTSPVRCCLYWMDTKFRMIFSMETGVPT